MHSSINCSRPPRATGPAAILALALILSGLPARADVATGGPLFYQSASLGALGQLSGAGISPQPPDQQWLGVRFQASTSAVITAVGGNLSVYNFFGDGLIFAALVKLTSLTDFPDSTDLSTPDVLATTTFTGTYPSTDAVIPIGPVAIGPGTYGLIFGSGLFGATSQGGMALDNAPVGNQSIFELSNNSWSELDQPGMRFTVYAVPEPGAAALLLLGASAWWLRTKSRSDAGD